MKLHMRTHRDQRVKVCSCDTKPKLYQLLVGVCYQLNIDNDWVCVEVKEKPGFVYNYNRNEEVITVISV
jgi:hypothetical protein